LKNFKPAHCGGIFSRFCDAVDHGEVEQMLAQAVEIHRRKLPQRVQGPVVAETLMPSP
jgi:hypothetical protein